MYKSSEHTIPEMPHEPLAAPVAMGDTLVSPDAQGEHESRVRVLPGEILEFGADEFDTVSSEGFAQCSAFLLRNSETGAYTFSHVQPFFGDLSKALSPEHDGRRVPRNIGPGEAVFVYGTRSAKQADVEPVMAAGRWGDISVRSIHIDTGTEPFHTMFTPETGVLSVISQTPESGVHQYQVFE